MQSIYTLQKQRADGFEKEEKFLHQSIENLNYLYLLLLAALTEIKPKEENLIDLTSKKHLATKEERNPNRKFVSNKVLQILCESESLKNAVESNKVTNWSKNDDIVLFLIQAIKESELYQEYMKDASQTFEKDKDFFVQLFTTVIAPNEKLYEYLEDSKLTWVDDLPLVNTFILKQLRQLKNEDSVFTVARLFKDQDDKEFVSALFRKTIFNEDELTKEYIDKTPNWDTERIAEIDTIILKLAICELLKFPSIPAKVTINEYLEIAKEYSTPKSSIFINGILDNLVKEFTASNRMNKAGRGLL
jgi:N utilization substance protein B